MAAYTIVLHGAAGCVSVTPKFDFTAGTVQVEVEDVYIDDLTSGVEHAAILLAEGEKLEYICSSWDSVTRIDIHGDKVSDDISGWVLPAGLTHFYVYSTSVSGDISGWILPVGLTTLYMNSTSVSGDISGWVLPANLIDFNIYSTSVSGDISGWILPANLQYFNVFSTSVSGDISDWTLSASLQYFSVYSTSLDYDSATGAFTGVTDSLTKIDFDDCTLTKQQVDNVLADLVTSGIGTGVSPKTIDIAGDNAALSNIGLINKVILEARGWTVTATATSAYDESRLLLRRNVSQFGLRSR